MSSICQLSAIELATQIRNKKLTALEVVEAYLSQIQEYNDELNSYITVTEKTARKAAQAADETISNGSLHGPLHGVPVAIKDLTPVRGVPHTYGAMPLADNVAKRDAAVVQRLKEAGAIIIGKTNTPEFGYKGTTDNHLLGPAKNPFNLQKNAGGSSGGSASAVAAGLAPLAHGTDGGGSIRIPASFCGVYGLKPSFGRIPRSNRPNAFAGHTPFLHHGPITRTVEDAALMLEVMSGPHPQDPLSLPATDESYLDALRHPVDDLQIAYTPDFDVFPIDDDVRTIVESAVKKLKSITAGVEEISIGHKHTVSELEESWKRGRSVQQAMTARTMAEMHGVDFNNRNRDNLPAELNAQIQAGIGQSALDVKSSDEVRTNIFDTIQNILLEYDVLVMPTLAVTAFDNGKVGPSYVNETPINEYIGWRPTYLFNLTGHPAASIPAGQDDAGLPVGLQIVGRRFAEDTVLAVSAAFERAQPWQAPIYFGE